MEWTEIKIKVNTNDIPLASDIANMVVPYGIYIEDYSDLENATLEIAHIDLIDEELTQKDRTVAYIHIYISPEDNPVEAVAFLSERYNAEKISNSIELVKVSEDDWAENWKQFFKPLEIGRRLAVCPVWENYVNNDNRVVLNIDPGVAFGTGGHDTTRLCLSVLDSVCATGKTVLDIGAGSGILATSSVLLGCDKADGVDIDAMAVKVAGQNAQLNNVADKCNFIYGNLVDKIDGKYDIVCANIVADVIISLCDNVGDYMTDDGIFICSGIIDMRENDVLAKLAQVGLKVRERYTSGGWVALLCTKENCNA